MNRTKRRIFETSIDLFAKKGYDATSIEEITSVVGIAKGTLYYHFSSKEEILDFLIDEGLKLLEHSLEIKIKKANSFEEKIYEILCVELKVVDRYENLINLIVKELCGNEKRNIRCRQGVYECVNVIEKVLIKAEENNEIVSCNPRYIAYEIFGIICSSTILKYENNGKIDIKDLASKYSTAIISGLKNR